MNFFGVTVGSIRCRNNSNGGQQGNSAQTLSGKRIESLLDENSFVEVGPLVTARNTDFNMTAQETAADGVITGYGTIEGSWCMCTARMGP